LAAAEAIDTPKWSVHNLLNLKDLGVQGGSFGPFLTDFLVADNAWIRAFRWWQGAMHCEAQLCRDLGAKALIADAVSSPSLSMNAQLLLIHENQRLDSSNTFATTEDIHQPLGILKDLLAGHIPEIHHCSKG